MPPEPAPGAYQDVNRRAGLGDGERVELDLCPHGRALVKPVLVLLLGLFLGSYAFFAVPAAWSPPATRRARWVVLGVVLIVLGRHAVLPFLRWRTTTAVVTNRRILLRSGVLARHGQDVPLQAVADVAVTRGLLDRLTGSGTMRVTSLGADPAGTGRAPAPVVLPAVPRVTAVQPVLTALVDAAAARTRQAPGPVPPGGRGSVPVSRPTLRLPGSGGPGAPRRLFRR